MKDLINLLLVDDSVEFSETVAELLEAESFSVKVAPNITEAKNILTNFDVDAVLCDFHMPDGNGLQLLKEIRGSGKLTPFILLSGNLSFDIILTSAQLGIFDIFEKPIAFDKLKSSAIQAINFGIHLRSLYENIKLLPEAKAKQATTQLGTLAKLRAFNYENKKKIS